MHAKPDQHIVIQVLCHVQQKLSVQLTPVDTKSKFLNVLSHARFQAGAGPRWQGLIVYLFILPPSRSPCNRKFYAAAWRWGFLDAVHKFKGILVPEPRPSPV